MEQKNQQKFSHYIHQGKNEQSPESLAEKYESVLLDLARVTRVTEGGKQLRFRAVVVVGNKKGAIGLGVAKAQDVSLAVEKATRLAKKHIIEVPIFEETIPHEVNAKYATARVLLRPQQKGKGLVAGGPVRIVCSLAGIKNISSKLLSRSRNKLNIARATIEALRRLKTKPEQNKNLDINAHQS